MPSERHLDLLSQLLLSAADDSRPGRPLALKEADLEPVLELANSHHVVVRALAAFHPKMAASGNSEFAQWATTALDAEHDRIQNALFFLDSICAAFAAADLDLTVIKSLDHWPDLGNDLDLYTNASPQDVIRLMRDQFSARLAPRSWGDRLAGKWNFLVPGLRELVEIHVGRLGQTGEHVTFARSIPVRARPVQAGNHSFSLACPEHRLMIATLQRMYRHFYFRLCDIVDTARLLETGPVNYPFLCASSMAAGIWEGVTSFLQIVSGYVERYRGTGIALPDEIHSAARMGADRVVFSRGFLRVPIMPEAVSLYTGQWRSLARRGELRGTFRLSLLPCLATAAVLEQKITGSDKGVW